VKTSSRRVVVGDVTNKHGDDGLTMTKMDPAANEVDVENLENRKTVDVRKMNEGGGSGMEMETVEERKEVGEVRGRRRGRGMTGRSSP
jgi:hypothetical protein